MILECHHISKAFLEVPVLTDVTFHLEKGDHAAIVGINGAGKSTLLKILIGELEADAGTVSIARDTTIGYLAQQDGLNLSSTIEEALLEVKKDLIEMEHKLSRYEEMMGRLSGKEQEELIEEYHLLSDRFQRENGYSYRGEITGILRGLGFSDEEFSKPVSTLSGGQKTRVALGRLLLEKPDIIILDEPTNHLDIESLRWLENYLSNYHGTVLIVSHDRYFLDKCVRTIIELDATKCLVFQGNYSAYAEKKKALREAQMRQYLNAQATLKHDEEVIAKLRQFNREKSIKRAESREKMMNRREKVEKPFEVRDDMHLSFRPCIQSGREVLTVRHLAKSFGREALFSDLGFQLMRGDHAAIIGSNGTGKTTLLKIINNLLDPDDGAIRFGTNVHIAYYDQEHQVLTDTNTLFDEISDAHPDMTITEIRSLLAAFLFTGDDVFKRIGDLSGGEKGRVSLAKLMLSEANLLILDEPTNHLDMVSKEVLENALNNYEGTVLYVSHDRYFINHTASRILSLQDRDLLSFPGTGIDTIPEKYLGNYDYFLEKTQEKEEAESAGAVRTHEPETANALDWKKQKEEQAKLRKKKNDLERLEARIAELEEKNADLDAEMAKPEICSDLQKLQELTTRRAAFQEELDGLYEMWEELQDE